jgi:hypothetical protein
MYAAGCGRHECVRILLDYNVDTTIKNKSNKEDFQALLEATSKLRKE